MFDKINSGGQFTIKCHITYYMMITYFTFDKELINRTCHVLQNIKDRVYTLSFKYFILNTICLYNILKRFSNNHETIYSTKMAVFFQLAANFNRIFAEWSLIESFLSVVGYN